MKTLPERLPCSIEKTVSEPNLDAVQDPLRKTRRALLVLSLLYFAVGVFSISPAYIDFGDGNYLYIADRITEGVRLYRDMVSPQPPVHLFAGALLLTVGKFLGQPLYTVRLFLIFLHLLTMCLVAATTWRLFRNTVSTFLSGLIFLLLPIGFWWSRGYQSENWVILWLLGVFYLLLPTREEGEPNVPNHRLALAGVGCVLGIMTNMTAVPYVFLFVLSSLIRFRLRSLYFMIPFILGLAVSFGGMILYSEGTYLDNVWSNQMRTYPQQGTLTYFAYKLTTQGLKVLNMEGSILLLALLGLAWFMKTDYGRGRWFVTWFALFSYGAIIFVTKGATMDYIFVLAEPMLAVFSAFFLHRLCSETGIASPAFWRRGAHFWPGVFIIPTVFVALFFPGINFEILTLQEQSYENPTDTFIELAQFIEDHSKPGDLILTPPYYAFYTNRILPEEVSSSCMWSFRFFSTSESGGKDPILDKFIQAIVDTLDNRTVRVVFLNQKLFGAIPPIRAAVERNYKMITDIKTLNEHLEIYLPKE